jgi:predicted  nucleic acid-binding Zn-ribbon protein
MSAHRGRRAVDGARAAPARVSAADFAFQDMPRAAAAAIPRVRAGSAGRENRPPPPPLKPPPPAAPSVERALLQLRSRLAEMERDYVLVTKRVATVETQLAERTAELERARAELRATRGAPFASAGGAADADGETHALRAHVRALSAQLAAREAGGGSEQASLTASRASDLRLEARMYYQECVRLQHALAEVADERGASRSQHAALGEARGALELARARERDAAHAAALDDAARAAGLAHLGELVAVLRAELGGIGAFVGLPPDDDDDGGGARRAHEGGTIEAMLQAARADAEEVASAATAERLRSTQRSELQSLQVHSSRARSARARARGRAEIRGGGSRTRSSLTLQHLLLPPSPRPLRAPTRPSPPGLSAVRPSLTSDTQTARPPRRARGRCSPSSTSRCSPRGARRGSTRTPSTRAGGARRSASRQRQLPSSPRASSAGARASARPSSARRASPTRRAPTRSARG